MWEVASGIETVWSWLRTEYYLYFTGIELRFSSPKSVSVVYEVLRLVFAFVCCSSARVNSDKSKTGFFIFRTKGLSLVYGLGTYCGRKYCECKEYLSWNEVNVYLRYLPYDSFLLHILFGFCLARLGLRYFASFLLSFKLGVIIIFFFF